MELKRYFFELSYKGTDFCGWQRQPNASSVQEAIESCLSSLNSNNQINVVGCGRTDTGVHAKQYFLHVDLPEMEDVDKMTFKLNRMLPDSIAIHRIFESDQHARFDAKSRTYRYFIHQSKDAFLHEVSWYFPQRIDLDKMNEAAKHLIGKKDFTSLSKLHTDVKTNICDVSEAHWVEQGEHIYFEITADRFLRNMVRAAVGTLLDVGMGKLNVDEVAKILEAKDRGEASMSVPPQGLFLWKIVY